MASGHEALDQPHMAMRHYLAALHCLDFAGKHTMGLEVMERRELHSMIVRCLANLSLAFLKREDYYNCERAAQCGLDYSDKNPESVTLERRAKLLVRRARARAPRGNVDGAIKDLK